MDSFYALADDDGDELGKLYGTYSPRDTTIQIVLSLALGIGAFLTFCVLRPRWPGLYAARKKQKNEATALPELPDTLFGWIIPLWKITDQQVLASAGLDAYVFLAFFKMAIRFLVITFFFSLVVIKPVHDAYPDEDFPGNSTRHNHTKFEHFDMRRSINLLQAGNSNHTVPFFPENLETDYLWMYVAFAYLFSGIAIYLVIAETRRIIEIRQEYLGSQTTVTDRTIRLSGIHVELQDEERLKDFLESLNIGKVENVTLCRQWGELDRAVTGRMDLLRRLEEAYTIYMSHRTVQRSLESLPIAQPAPPGPAVASITDENEEEDAGLMGVNGQTHPAAYARVRPQATVRYGRFKLHSKRVDAIDHYTELLRQADDRIKALRQKTFAPTALAFVTMDSVASSQMAIQAVLDPSPLHLIANQSPSPADIIWPMTYLSRWHRLLRKWSITALIVLLTIFWSAIFVPVAGLLSTDSISRLSPEAGKFLDEHPNAKSLVVTQLPTLLATLLTVLVPYLYYYLSWYQGEIAQGDIELSAISKNFFFTFFNFFVIFTVLGTASKFYQFFERFNDLSRDLRKIAYTLALSLQRLLTFYVNFIILQGVGLFPLRLLEIGSMSLYPISLMGAKTPRDYAELVQPPIFSYGFYLPTALLIFIICMVYSVLRSSWQVLLAGLLFFLLGHYTYKYQLLYAMDHQQQSTGRAWGMICDRIFVGLVFFQLTTAGQLILKQAVTRSVLMIPLVAGTIWISILYGRAYKPLMQFIALRSVQRGEQYRDETETSHGQANGDEEVEEGGEGEESTASSSNELVSERNVWADTAMGGRVNAREASQGFGSLANPDESKSGLRFVNPSLVAPLKGVWIAGRKNLPASNGDERVSGEDAV
ncbi:hypothetical protein LTR91_026125 [Friedmanniomyces endolithicus]|uniref:DUF221-domain-containing protein n=1 Tax=Friedmanniomyces endolithicus TaxID=329885 RepID=A0AAN6GXH6_9PEZI|nr:hypothetical protein LTR35_006676 [Friedmanniomyces endolithicus]KAK0297060.1 hypothetical protein LTS00_004339 [Friedmanniomyces endolithicus]KAK0928135.1 hypothetical protein LTR57_002869 [Friedmanniomyces endolithicus]KAK0949840.1 hypothetical protein LTR91_026125 [Friedmanniomyces endolithicus]KAK1012812.1 hypothetical protein LTR54_004739 [Friedmanniomyces endolithicus]